MLKSFLTIVFLSGWADALEKLVDSDRCTSIGVGKNAMVDKST
jgi:hypothetical protein